MDNGEVVVVELVVVEVVVTELATDDDALDDAAGWLELSVQPVTIATGTVALSAIQRRATIFTLGWWHSLPRDLVPLW